MLNMKNIHWFYLWCLQLRGWTSAAHTGEFGDETDQVRRRIKSYNSRCMFQV